MSQIFISHTALDRPFVERELIALLKALGFIIWFGDEAVLPAEHWERSILSGLEESKWVVIIMSKYSETSEWVRDEVNWAIEKRPETIIPILIDDCNPRDIHIRLPRIQRIDYRSNPTQAALKLIKLLVDAEYAPTTDELDRRHLTGKWISAVQPVYYPSKGWHIQDVEIIPSQKGYTVETFKADKKLQWHMEAKLVANTFLVGRWWSRRKAAESHGYMTLQISRNGQYLFGHDYGIVFKENESNFGVLLLGQTEDSLQSAWTAMASGRREMLPLTNTEDFLQCGGIVKSQPINVLNSIFFLTIIRKQKKGTLLQEFFVSK